MTENITTTMTFTQDIETNFVHNISRGVSDVCIYHLALAMFSRAAASDVTGGFECET